MTHTEINIPYKRLKMKHLRPQGRFQVLTSAHPTYQGFDPFFLLLLISPLYQLKIRAAQKTNTGRTEGKATENLALG